MAIYDKKINFRLSNIQLNQLYDVAKKSGYGDLSSFIRDKLDVILNAD